MYLFPLIYSNRCFLFFILRFVRLGLELFAGLLMLVGLKGLVLFKESSASGSCTPPLIAPSRILLCPCLLSLTRSFVRLFDCSLLTLWLFVFTSQSVMTG
ncbi:hypothetical protein HanXRQr2_Chr15g0703581 [Helianthus annuus]|uniref:Uncharacterized protein n=1 Tax=Helianthus annuus TaxID=4232 RepID=A0A9K3E1P8_HELAN|nr:hypothetical protein HanXRQr2_Chr15g0703581 [Helianthus annuus]KAJ0832116.1 hypothetical protein HanPSC8_Chr15g0675051 [Helianthus annuus]